MLQILFALCLLFMLDARPVRWHFLRGQCALCAPLLLGGVCGFRYSSFFGQSVFLFAVHSVVLPISQAMRYPRKFDQGPFVGTTDTARVWLRWWS